MKLLCQAIFTQYNLLYRINIQQVVCSKHVFEFIMNRRTYNLSYTTNCTHKIVLCKSCIEDPLPSILAFCVIKMMLWAPCITVMLWASCVIIIDIMSDLISINFVLYKCFNIFKKFIFLFSLFLLKCITYSKDIVLFTGTIVFT